MVEVTYGCSCRWTEDVGQVDECSTHKTLSIELTAARGEITELRGEIARLRVIEAQFNEMRDRYTGLHRQLNQAEHALSVARSGV